jgi:hypothetical protein
LKLIICFRHLKCICRKWCRGMDYAWHVQHLLREFGCGALAELPAVSEWKETSREANCVSSRHVGSAGVQLAESPGEAFTLWGWRTGRTRCAKPFSQAATSDSLAAAAKNDLSCRRPMKELPAISRGAFRCGASSRRLGLFPSTSFRQSFLLACRTGVSYFRDPVNSPMQMIIPGFRCAGTATCVSETHGVRARRATRACSAIVRRIRQ